MNIILTIIKREYLVRVRKKSFIVMTLLAPLLMAAFYGAIGWAAVGSISQKKVAIVDQNGQFKGQFKNNDETAYVYPTESLASAKASLANKGYDALVVIPADVIEQPKTVQIFSNKSVSLSMQSNIESAISKRIERIKLSAAGITQQVIEDAKVNVDATTINLSDQGEKNTNSIITTVIGGFCAFLIYLSVFIYGAQVMRGVLEEKTNRIIEVIISSVKPFQLMMGKIVGVGLVGLTQFLLWILLTIGVISAGTAILGAKYTRDAAKARTSMAMGPGQADVQRKMENSKNPVAELTAALDTLNVPLIVFCFIFYFLGGYLLYSSLFGAIGAAVDSETETQQFMFPITIPIIASIALAQFIVRDPDGPLAFWMSMIPFTSPIIMMVRIPFGVPVWQLVLSMALLVAGFLATTWLAARIYRVGILMYGKKPTYKELSKWIFYKA
ncbi:ABC-type Na+ efflux pump permease component-like protein [Fibrella aestuarina BUZ 2]|uniref:ABC-type Na+ efflux pump permease component-like protein n=1 Tax=Fibrella aestuarina BUZ 2 TaxID=1166018 RepID=I0K5S2_9BACT|nr:ABC transporter permease [Fibrella aestuarina]CCG99475.1 ABC-type Na+ efflux pump permease component-like protein [Fibrella aestuarina BUZ 2]